MLQTEKNQEPTLENSVDRFLFRWHDFPFDYWWRKRHGVAFGSSAHREMSFLDMYIEWREDLMITRALEKQGADEEGGWTQEDYANIGLSSKNGSEVRLTQEEIDEDYENLNLEEFDKE